MMDSKSRSELNQFGTLSGVRGIGLRNWCTIFVQFKRSVIRISFEASSSRQWITDYLFCPLDLKSSDKDGTLGVFPSHRGAEGTLVDKQLLHFVSGSATIVGHHYLRP
ncbi:hypothetical protein VNO77_42697 [Canavalia gladiata]|uniref:Uncharacterized protein n=1 Tax=Canavalia gladiata TaxID=3824 RepID=A0AAN9JTD5_CANGL